MARPTPGDSGSESGSTPSRPSEETSARETVIGRIIGGNFRVLKLIGAGAMGHVYQAEQLSLGKVVAVKLLRQELMADETLIRRFELEARNASLLNHPHSIQIIDFGRDGGLLYIAMEYLQGLDLGQLILREGPLPLWRIGRIMDQILAALDEAHAMGLVHRDLKPGNIMLVPRRDDPDFVKVCDFGIAKAQTPGSGDSLTLKGLVCGTPEYMSPEQARGQEVDGRSDLYALGVLLYQLLTGDVPFTAPSPVEILSKQLGELPAAPSQRRPELGVPAALEALVLRALAKDPLGRPPSARQMRRELTLALGQAGTWNPRPASPSELGLRAHDANSVPTTPITIARAAERSPPESGFLPPTATSSHALRETRAVHRRGSAVAGGALVLGAVVGLLWISRPESQNPPMAPIAAEREGTDEPGATQAITTDGIGAGPGAPAPVEGDGESGPEEPAARSVTDQRPRPTLREANRRPERKRAGAARAAGARARAAEARADVPAPSNEAETGPVTEAAAFQDQPTSTSAAAAGSRTSTAPTDDAASVMAEARTLLAAGEIAAACAKGETGKVLAPEEPAIHRFLGKCYMRAGNPEKAKESYRRYLELAPQAADAAFIRSIVR